MEDGTKITLDHGAVVIAAITSCTNTSNPYVMVAAALVAKKAVEKGITRKPWVKTTLAPGSKVVSDYYDKADLTKYLDAVGFNLVGYGCTTCIGNSGPLPTDPARVYAHECLMRGVSPEGGTTPPGPILDAADEEGMMFHLDRVGRLNAIRGFASKASRARRSSTSIPSPCTTRSRVSRARWPPRKARG